MLLYISIKYSQLKKTQIMKAELKNDSLVITLPFNKKGELSKSGKTTVHATTNGNKETTIDVGGKPLIIGVNAYVPLKDKK